MSEPNPFEQATATNIGRRPPPPALVIPPTPPRAEDDSPEQPNTGSSSAGVNTGTNSAPGRPTRRVQWPAELSTHASHTMAPSASSPQTLQDLGAQDALTRALEEHRRNPDRPLPSRYVGNSAPPSETASRAESSDGDNEERMNDMRENMEVFVDPGETDGLPSVGTKSSEAKTSKAAWGLVRGYTSGAYGVMRHRKNGGFKGGLGEGAAADPEKRRDEETRVGTSSARVDDGDEKNEGGVGGFLKNLINSDSAADIPSEGFSNSTSMGGVGVLSALMALQAQQQNPTSSGTTSAATSPGTSRTASVINDDGDESDEEMERIKFTEKQRAKRNSKNAFHSTSSAVADATKYVTGPAYSVAKATGAVLHLGGHHPHKRAPSVMGGAELAPPLAAGGTSAGGSQPESVAASTGPPGSVAVSRSNSGLPVEATVGPGPGYQPRKKSIFGETVQQIKKIGETFGIEHETSRTRPDAARSSAGVFGGLVLSTGNIASIASPTATKLAPQVTRPGYHLSRYSAPTVPTIKDERRSRPQSIFGGSEPDGSVTKASTAANSAPGTPLRSTSPAPPPGTAMKAKPGFTLNLKDLAPHAPKFGFHSGKQTPTGEFSPRRESYLGDYFQGGHQKESQEEREMREWEKEKKRRRKVKEKRKQEEVFITQHVAAILSRQEFLMKMGRAFMMFGAPSHRLEAQIQATARVLEINCQAIYIPGVLLMSFGDAATHTSDIKFLKQANGLDLGKLLGAYYVYYNVVHDKLSVTDASIELDELMRAPPKYKLWQQLIIGGLASAFIQPSAFYGSLIDCLISIPLGALLVLVQVLVSRNDLYSSLFEIVIACVSSFLAAALASTGQFCFSAVASGSVVLILPGYIVLCGSLELANRSIVSGSVRLVYSILYSLFLGFGLAMGGEVYQRTTGKNILGAMDGSIDYTCSSLRVDAPWYRATIPQKWYIFTIPMYCLMLGLRNGQPMFRKETIIMLLIGSAGFVANFYGSKAFVDRADISSALGSFTVGFLGNMYGKFTRASSPFVVMVVGVLIQLPSGLSNGGLLNFAVDSSSATSYSAGFSTAQSLVEVAIGLTVGLFLAAAVVNVAGGGRRRGSNLSSF
ncbi:hypothetical protein RQP46_003371 [Phenoliferia psychrophenolica]